MNQENGSWLAKAIASGALKWIGFQLAASAGPIILGVITTMSARLTESVPWMWALTAGALTFGGAAAGVHYTLSIRHRYAVRGRLALAHPRLCVEMATGDLALGVDLNSIADVPIEFEIRDIQTEIDGIYPPRKPFEKVIFEIPPRGYGFFTDNLIKIERSSSGAEAKIGRGSVIATIAYGKPGSRNNTLKVKTRVHIRFSEQGAIDMSWNELA